jgi:hypothetical protein
MDEKLTKSAEVGAPYRLFDPGLPALGKLSKDAVAGLALAAADVALVVGPDNVVVDVAFHDASLAQLGIENWVSRKVHDTVTPESIAKLDSLLAEARGNQFARRREINHVCSWQCRPAVALLRSAARGWRRCADYRL